MRRRARGNMAIEAALLIPVLLLLIVGTVQLGKVTYTYYALKKIVYSAAREVAVQQGVNFCDVAGDTTAQNAINFALNDPATQAPIVAGLTTLQVTTRCADPANAGGALIACDASNCDAFSVSQRPDYVTVTIPNGYAVTVRIPFLNPIPVTLNPTATVPFGGVS
jgi:Flp pilus assembly protein TadG